MINLLALKVPGFTDQYSGPPNLRSVFDPNTFTLGAFLSELLPIVLYIATFLSFIWFVWGAFQWIFSSGNKEAIAKARSRITYALVGLAITLISLFIANYAQDIIKPRDIPPQQVTSPPVTLRIIPQAQAATFDIGQAYPFGDISNLGEGTSRLVKPAFSIAATVVVIYIVIAAFKWISSSGDKEVVASSQKMITHAIVGFIILMLSFIIFQYFMSALFNTSLLRIIGIP